MNFIQSIIGFLLRKYFIIMLYILYNAIYFIIVLNTMSQTSFSQVIAPISVTSLWQIVFINVALFIQLTMHICILYLFLLYSYFFNIIFFGNDLLIINIYYYYRKINIYFFHFKFIKILKFLKLTIILSSIVWRIIHKKVIYVMYSGWCALLSGKSHLLISPYVSSDGPSSSIRRRYSMTL